MQRVIGFCAILFCALFLNHSYGGQQSAHKSIEPFFTEIFPGYMYFSYREKTRNAEYTDAEAHMVILQGMKEWKAKMWKPIPDDWDFHVSWRTPTILEVRPILGPKSKFPTAFLVRYK